MIKETICRICNKGNLTELVIREMMFGTRDEFTYGECNNCGCIQLINLPKDMSPYYPLSYYSLNSSPIDNYSNPIEKAMRQVRDKYAISGKGFLGKVLYNYFPNETILSLKEASINKSTRILDVGCGKGQVLYSLKELGYKNLLGTDPYLEKDITYDNGLTILKKSINEIEGEWDIIMLHHVIEHIDNPLETIQSLAKHLSKRGILIIRTPIVPCVAMDKYGTNWVQLDAPRHINIFSVKGIKTMLEKTNLQIERAKYDSTTLQFWGSEQYKNDISLWSNESYKINKKKSIFDSKTIKYFSELTSKLNKVDPMKLESAADQVVLYLTRRDN